VFTLPVVLIILDLYPLRRRAWREKIPLVVLAVIGAGVAMAASAQSGLSPSLAEYGLGQRIAQSFYGLAFYLQKTLLPIGLSPIYSIPPDLDPLAAPYVVSAVIVIGLTIVLVAARRRFPAGLTTWAIFVVILAPVLGLAQTGNQIAADRYTYLPAVAVSALLAAGLARINLTPRLAMVPILVIAGLLTWKQVGVWRDPETLWRHAVSVNPGCYISNANLDAVR
jgi:hypothetical protein